MAYDAPSRNQAGNSLYIIEYPNLDYMLRNISTTILELPRSLNSVYETNPSIESVKWGGSVTKSEMTILFQYLDTNETLHLGKGIYSENKETGEFEWKTYSTTMNTVFKQYDLLESFKSF